MRTFSTDSQTKWVSGLARRPIKLSINKSTEPGQTNHGNISIQHQSLDNPTLFQNSHLKNKLSEDSPKLNNLGQPSHHRGGSNLLDLWRRNLQQSSIYLQKSQNEFSFNNWKKDSPTQSFPLLVKSVDLHPRSLPFSPYQQCFPKKIPQKS